MRFSHFFVDRPIFAGVISIIVTLVGFISFRALPVAEYPEIAPPTVVVSATFAGASAEVIAQTVAAPIEQEINGVDNMLYVVSQSTGDGALEINVVFKTGTDIDQAQVLVQNRVSVALPRLPEEVQRFGVTVRKSSPDLMLVIHLLSPDGSLDQQYISNYATINIKDVITRIDGVGDTIVFGARDYSMRVWLDPALVQARGLTTSDVVAALRAANVQVAAGAINQPPATSPGAFQVAVQTLGRLSSPDQFSEIIVATDPDGRVTRVRDIARVELGAQDYTRNAYLDNKVAAYRTNYGGRSFEESQRTPGDYDAQVSQGPIARHGLEHLTSSDRGVTMFRRAVRDGIEAVRRGLDPKGIVRHPNGKIPTYANEAVIHAPRRPGANESQELKDAARRICEAVLRESVAMGPSPECT